MPGSSNIEKARRYLRVVESGTFDELAALFAPEAVVEQLPNRIYPNGARVKALDSRASFEKGRMLFSSQKYEITKEVVDADTVALEVLWTGKLAVSFGNLQAASEMRAYSAMFLEFQDAKIAAQRNYDCFEPCSSAL